MNIRQPWVDHHEWTDSVADWAESHPITTRAHRALPLPAERQWVAPQGRIEQGWPARRCSSEPTVIDQLPEDYDKPKPVVGKEAVKFWAVASAPAIALLGVVGYTIWVRFGHVF